MSNQGQGKDVMLSIHCGTMLEKAKELRNFLQDHGYTVFLCEQMTGGADFRNEICANAAKCQAMVAFVNKRWCDSGECMFEFNIALRLLLVSQKQPLIIPLLLEDFNVYSEYPVVFGVICSLNGIVSTPAGLNNDLWEKVLASLRGKQIRPSGTIPAGNPVPPAAQVPPPKPKWDLQPVEVEIVTHFLQSNPVPADVTTPVPPIPANHATVPKQAPVNLNFPIPRAYSGKGVRGNRNGPIATAYYESITGITANESENVIYVSTLAHTIRKIARGVVTTYAGFQGEEGADDGSLNVATFRAPSGVAVAQDGSLYVSDARNYKIRRVFPDGTVVTEAGTGEMGDRGKNAEGAATFFSVGSTGAIAVYNKDSTIYFVNKDTESIQKIAAGQLTTLAGTGKSGFADGAGKTAQFDGPEGIAVLESDGSVLVADRSNNRIRQISADGKVTTFAGSGKKGQDDGPAAAATFYFPTQVAVDSRDGSVFVADQFGCLIRKISKGTVTTIAAIPDAKITGLTVLKGILYVAEAYNIRAFPL